MPFSSLKLHPRLLDGVRDLGYKAPTPIQAGAIPPVLEGRDVLGLAQTGTGKTAAFGLPILQRLMEGDRSKPRALIVAPTRELAEQIHEAIVSLGKHAPARSVTIYGGVAMGPQLKALRSGVDLIVACPGRLLDHCQQRTIDLSHIEVLVLDEADRLFDMGFMPDVRRIIAKLPAKRQNLLFSATMPPDIRRLAHDILVDPVTVQVDPARPTSTVAHALYPVAEHLKTDLLVELVRRTGEGSVLVFTRTKNRCRRVARRLDGSGFTTACMQGDMSQRDRQEALDGFKDGKYRVLVATDIAARGIDVTDITHVINYDVPDSVDAYTHRIGRTGRAAKTGDAFTLMTFQDHGMIQAIERTIGTPIERRLLDGFDYGRRVGALPSAAPSAPAGDASAETPQGFGTVLKTKPSSLSGFRNRFRSLRKFRRR